MKSTNKETLEQLARAFSTKRAWVVRKADKPRAFKPSDLLRKLLLLRHFELEVASNIIEAQVPEEIKGFYEEFVKDEYKHDKQLAELAKHCGCADDEPPQDLICQYEQLREVSHPLLMNFLLEQLFLVSLPLVQKHGDVFANYCAAWILSDEAVHVRFGRLMLNELNLTIEEHHIDFLMMVLDFLGLPEKSRKVLLQNLLHGTAAKELMDEQVILSPRISFFEQGSVSYGVTEDRN